MRRRVLVALVTLVAGWWLLATGPAASAHGALERAEPAAGASLQRAPGTVRLTFTEAPERRLSSVRVLDAAGRPVGGGTAPAPGDPRTLQTALTELPAGTYTVSWRIVSAVDGHPTTGAFSFGVGTPAPAAPAGAGVGQTLAGPGPLAVAGRWAFFAGLALLVGAAATGLLVFRLRLPGRRAVLLLAAVAVAAAGLAAMTSSIVDQAGAPLGQVLASATGRWLLWRGLALAAAAVAAAAVLAQPAAERAGERSDAVHGRPPEARAWPLLALGVAAAGGMLAHAMAGHAAAPSPARWLHLLSQWAHLVAVGVWIGGLVWLLAGLRGRARRTQVLAVLRFSRLATVSLAAVVATGLARTMDEVGGWGGLTGTGFGRILLVKLALFGGLLLLGAANHYRVVPGLRSGRVPPGRLRGTVGGELALASAVLLSAALLSALPPGAGGTGQGPGGRPAPGSPAPVRVQAAGTDYTTSVRVTLTVSPGTAGPNRFTAELADYDSGRPAQAERVWLACVLPDRPDMGSLELDLRRTGEGSWAASGSALPLTGRWDVTAWVEGASGTVTVPLRVQVGRPGAGGELASGR